jgi:hypothetical protein
MRSVGTALAAGLALTVVASALVLSRSPLTVLAANSTALSAELAVSASHTKVCQAGEQLPAGTVGIRLSLAAFTGPAVSVNAVSGGRILTSGDLSSGWDGNAVTIPVRALSHSNYPVKICFAIPVSGGEGVKLLGSLTSPADAAHAVSGGPLKGRLRIEYLGNGRSSWLTLLPSVARHMGLGHAWGGIWIAVLVAMLMLIATVLASRLILRELNE